MRVERPFVYVWAWSQPSLADFWKKRTSGYFDRDRKGEKCRILARGTKNSVLLEFEDGYKVVTSRHGLRR